MNVYGCLLAASLAVLIVPTHGSSDNDESRLYMTLMSNYDHWNPDRALRPVVNTTQTLKLKFGISLVKILKFNEEAESMKLLLWEKFMWHDAYLSWDPADFGGIESLRIPSCKIWRPDVLLYSNPEPANMGADNLNVVIYHTGDVVYVPPRRREVDCDQEKKEVLCKLKYGSWTYDANLMDIDFYEGLKAVDVADYVPKKLAVKTNMAKKNEKTYPCCEEPYQDLEFIVGFAQED